MRSVLGLQNRVVKHMKALPQGERGIGDLERADDGRDVRGLAGLRVPGPDGGEVGRSAVGRGAGNRPKRRVTPVPHGFRSSFWDRAAEETDHLRKLRQGGLWRRRGQRWPIMEEQPNCRAGEAPRHGGQSVF